MTHHHPNRCPRRGRCAASLRAVPAAQPNEGDVPVNLRPIAAAAALTLCAATPGFADSRASRGMGRGDGPCIAVATPTEAALLRLESRGWPTADNPASSAYGCGQLLRALRRAHYPAGCPLETVDVACQMAGFRSYVRARYGTAGRALAIRRSKGWY